MPGSQPFLSRTVLWPKGLLPVAHQAHLVLDGRDDAIPNSLVAKRSFEP